MYHMVFHMKTTLNIDDTVMQRLREEAARQGLPMSKLVEAGLRRMLEASDLNEEEGCQPLPFWRSQGELVDVADRNALYERMG